ncbi:hypothetical protein FACS18945_5800 [Bacteroidia bacterium]|nr:hypothetical protein FACS18945_5800 [Bacteroidia bacterium]
MPNTCSTPENQRQTPVTDKEIAEENCTINPDRESMNSRG